MNTSRRAFALREAPVLVSIVFLLVALFNVPVVDAAANPVPAAAGLWPPDPWSPSLDVRILA